MQDKSIFYYYQQNQQQRGKGLQSSHSMHQISQGPRNTSHDSHSFRASSDIGLYQDSSKKQPLSRTASKQTIKDRTAAEILVIHVFDENRQTTKDFKCPRQLLLDNMKYFETYLKDSQKNEDIDI